MKKIALVSLALGSTLVGCSSKSVAPATAKKTSEAPVPGATAPDAAPATTLAPEAVKTVRDPKAPPAPHETSTTTAKDDVKIMLKTANGKLVAAPAPKALPHVEEAKEEAQKSEATVPESAKTSPPAPKALTPTEALAADTKEKDSNERVRSDVSAEKSLAWLKNGNTRFKKGYVRKDGQGKADLKRTVGAQHPHAIVLACADSRVPPELIFDQKLGEIFVVRNPGPTIDSTTVATLEYAVRHLGPNHLVVMGHTSCALVRAAVGTLQGGGLGSPSLNEMVGAMHPRLQKFASQPPSKDFADEARANVDGIAHELIERSEIIRDAVAKGGLKISRALYHLDDGNVDFSAE